MKLSPSGIQAEVTGVPVTTRRLGIGCQVAAREKQGSSHRNTVEMLPFSATQNSRTQIGWRSGSEARAWTYMIGFEFGSQHPYRAAHNHL